MTVVQEGTIVNRATIGILAISPGRIYRIHFVLPELLESHIWRTNIVVDKKKFVDIIIDEPTSISPGYILSHMVQDPVPCLSSKIK